MTLPAQDALAISGTAAVVGHASAHEDDLDAQLGETLTNLEALLASAGMAAGFDTHSPLKTYVRHSADLAAIRDVMQERMGPQFNAVFLQADVCRHDLLVEMEASASLPA